MSNSDPLVVQGRVWLFADDNINTDLMMPQTVFAKSLEVQLRHVFATYRPGWIDEVRAGDILVGGRNFGTGSSRPGSMLLKRLGIAALVAETINGLFYRNCVNYALPAMECSGIRTLVNEGDTLRVDITHGSVENLTRGQQGNGVRMPDFLQAIVRAGGIMERLKTEGYL
ncbi:MAG TPA: 3-isopropylmalate dehydratase [Candidatus Binataceae bacterium]|nr:3-isopropylmalate dehydratase [Candidatus Binataceae bacterium]